MHPTAESQAHRDAALGAPTALHPLPCRPLFPCRLSTLPTIARQYKLILTAQCSSHPSCVTHPQGCVIPVALAQGLNAQAASSAQHGPAAVDDLALCEALQALRVLAQTQGVEAVVAVGRSMKSKTWTLRTRRTGSRTLKGCKICCCCCVEQYCSWQAGP